MQRFRPTALTRPHFRDFSKSPTFWYIHQPWSPFRQEGRNHRAGQGRQTGKVELTLDTSSINTGTTAFDKHLQSDSFFNSAAFPNAKFVSNNFSFSGDKVSEVSVSSPFWARPIQSCSRRLTSTATSTRCSSARCVVAISKPPFCAVNGTWAGASTWAFLTA